MSEPTSPFLDRPREEYNIGINVGEAAGQTVAHLHVHVIPSKGNYLADGSMLRQKLQGLDGARIHAPRAVGLRPAEDVLAERFELFRQAG